MGDDQRRVRLPAELQGVHLGRLEEYVRARLIQFAGEFARRMCPTLSLQLVQQAAADAIQSLPPVDVGRVAVESRDLQLVFRHDCLSLGCLDQQCSLCEHNPHRRCNVNFAPKYLVNDVLKAKCDAPIRVEIIDRATGVPLGEDIPDVHLEMCILDGNAYDAKCLEAGQERDDDLDACSLLVNNKQTQPLLMPGAGASHSSASKVVVQLSRGMAQLPDLHVSDSSEAMLSGRKPPFRLLVRAVAGDGRKVSIRHAVSEGFVVATRRTRTAGKVEIPNVDDHVSKLEHMGKETVKKLQDIHTSGLQAGVEINVPDNCINKVGEFRKLALMAEADGHLRQKLQQVLKLSKEKWDDARDHAMKAVVADNRMRIWYVDKTTMEVGLLFTCRLGNVDLDRPVGLLQKKSQDGTQTTMEATLMAQQTPAQREQVRQLQPQAVASWWQPGHPGWAIYPVDSEQFMSSGSLDSVSVQHEHIVAPVPPANAALAGPPSPTLPYGGMQAPFAGYANGGHMGPSPPGGGAGGFLPPEMAPPPPYNTRYRSPSHMPAPAIPPSAPKQERNPSTTTPFAGMSTRSSANDRVNSGGAANASGQSNVGGPAQSSPFARMHGNPKGQQLQLDSMPSLGLGFTSLANMFSGPLNSTELNKYGSALGLTGFPSIPAPLPSGELEHLLQQHGEQLLSPNQLGSTPFGHNMGRAGSMGMGKLESMELPDAVAAVAMLHDMPPEQRNHVLHMPHMQRSNSGLESMQSIEQALGNVEQDIMDKVAEDWMHHHPNPAGQAHR
ncbi:hypothetical protein WJX72_004040 [[Myrmecia] bisecta]|uniref:CSE family protein n=1 Tax=[Myrmecia] bisecta TaxID=41462 RepID=A0AAW1P3Q8_9CHLO